MTTLEVRNLRKNFGDVAALTDVSLTVKPGEIYGFVGSNGAGKSTRCASSWGCSPLTPARCCGTANPSPPIIGATSATCQRSGACMRRRKSWTSWCFWPGCTGLTPKKPPQTPRSFYEQLGLAERKTSQLTDLSLGNQQRVQLAASLVHNPDVLVLDEPFSGLDPIAVQVMSDMLISRAQQGTPVIFSSHQ